MRLLKKANLDPSNCDIYTQYYSLYHDVVDLSDAYSLFNEKKTSSVEKNIKIWQDCLVKKAKVIKAKNPNPFRENTLSEEDLIGIHIISSFINTDYDPTKPEPIFKRVARCNKEQLYLKKIYLRINPLQ